MARTMSLARSEANVAPLILIGTAGDPRVSGFHEALARAGQPDAHVISYQSLLADAVVVADHVRPGAVIRIESPGRDPTVLAGLLMRGAALSEARDEIHVRAAAIPALMTDRGRLLPARQMYRGFIDLLTAALTPVLTSERTARLLPDLETIRLAFDKSACHAHVTAQGIPTPRCLPSVTSFDHLLETMRQQRLLRVFIKLQHGSAAAGVIALATSPRGMMATTTVDMTTNAHGAVTLYNTRRVRHVSDRNEIVRLFEALRPYGVHVEEWVAKAGVEGLASDLRVLVVAGEPAHVVLRKSKHPMTNLHLGGERADANALLSRMNEAARHALFETARRTARLFPGALHLGLDIAVATDLRRHALLEVNVFGDLLKGVLHNGLDPYALQVKHLRAITAGAVP